MAMSRFSHPLLLAGFLAAILGPNALAQSSDMTILKTGPAQAAADTDVPYTVTVGNNGPDASLTVTVADTIPAGMTFVSESHDPAFTCTTPAVGGTGTVSCTSPSLAFGATANFTFVFHIDASEPAGTQYSNVATVSVPNIIVEGNPQNSDPNEENNSSLAFTQIPPPPSSDIGVTKNGPGVAGPDTDVIYTITFFNAGPDSEPEATLTDTLPGTMTFVSLSQSGASVNCTTPAVGAGGTITCTAAPLAANTSTTLTLTGHIPAGTQSGTTFTNTATVAGSNDQNSENDLAFTELIVSSVDVSVTKTGPPSVTAGDTATYTITVANTGPDVAIDITLTDNLPPGTTFASLTQNNGPFATCGTPSAGTNGQITCTWAAMTSTESAQFTLVVNSGSATSIPNTANVSSQSFDSDNSNNTSTVTTTVTQVADLSVTKSGPATVTAGTNATYSIGVSNAGPSFATSVVLNDPLPANTTFVSLMQTSGPTFNCTTGATLNCTLASLAPGEAATFDLVVAVASTAPNASTISNTVTATSSTDDPTSNSATTNATVVTSADLSVTKGNGPGGMVAGTNASYLITATNAGPSSATSVQLTDVLPANTTFVSLMQTSGPTFNCTTGPTITCTLASFPPGAPATFDLVVAVASSTPNGTLISNTADISSATVDPTPGNNSSTTSAVTVAASADLSVTKSGPTAVAPGADITYTVTVANSGPSDAASVQLTDTLPAGTTFVSGTQPNGPTFNCTYPSPGATGTITCTIPSLVSGASAIFTFVFHVAPTATGTITNTATVSSTTADPNQANGSATSSPAAVSPETTDVSITKSASGARFSAGTNVTYTIIATNNGPAVATNVVVTDVLPPGTTLVSATTTQGSCSGTTTVTCNAGVLLSGGNVTITLVVQLPFVVGSVSNTATVTSDNADSNPANNSATSALAVTGEIPSLSPLALALLAMALAGVSLFVMKR
jgi:large repetitive protein